MQKTAVAALFSLFTAFACTQARATPFSLVYSDVISGFDVFGPEPMSDVLSIGDSAVITLVVDNGGDSLFNQSWTAVDLRSITFNFGNGKIVTTFSYPSGGGDVDFQEGRFVTDGEGIIREVPTPDPEYGWSDIGDSNVTSNSSSTLYVWAISGLESPYIQDSSDIKLQALDAVPNGELGMRAGSWTISATAVPEPSTYAALAAAGALGFAVCRRRRAA